MIMLTHFSERILNPSRYIRSKDNSRQDLGIAMGMPIRKFQVFFCIELLKNYSDHTFLIEISFFFYYILFFIYLLNFLRTSNYE